MNAAIKKVGQPATRIAEFDHCIVLLRPSQPTLGALVLAAKSEATAFVDLPAAAHADLKTATAAIEAALTRAVTYARINYLMLMMVDPHVDRKSTRQLQSLMRISFAVFCLKKKNFMTY